MPDWHFTVKFHLPVHTSILFGSLLQTLVPQRLRPCAQLYALSQKGQSTVNEVKHLCSSFTEGCLWTVLYVLSADDLNNSFYTASQKISKLTNSERIIHKTKEQGTERALHFCNIIKCSTIKY